MINYTIIIPHKNIPSLLEQCVHSIPQREDVQIIVVDDNSDEKYIAKLQLFEHSYRQDNLSIYYLNESQAKGAGHARNVGLEHALGKWILFADSDDTFETTALNAAFDKYTESTQDIIYFGIKCLDAKSKCPMKNANQSYLDHLYSKDDTANKCRYKIQVPWGKFIRRQLIEHNQIKFDETKVGNDAWFSLQTGYWANSIDIDYSPIYNWMVRSGSITSNRSKEAMMAHLNLVHRLNSFKEAHNLSKYRSNIFAFMPMLVRAKFPIHTAFGLCLKNTSGKYILQDIFNVIKKNLIQ